MIAPHPVNLSGADDGEEADYIRPYVIEDEENDQGENAQTDRPI